MESLFNSRDTAFRSPTGAVAEGTVLHFKINLPRALRCSAAYLMVRDDGSRDETVLALFWCGMNGEDREFWECHYTTASAGLFWYRFELDTSAGRRTLSRASGGEGHLSPGRPWQLTVYKKRFATPDWPVGGIMYQIFPDRFFCSGTIKKEVPSDRTLHSAWDEPPQWEPDARGEVTNSDYFGGDLLGITQKLEYLKSLGVTCLYLNPIFEAHSNHRYNTADYSAVDPLLGTKQDFANLCKEAKKAGIKILLDGVFSHTGSDSIYFNREKRYPEDGAYNSRDSKYYSWYHFTKWPEKYNSWWGFITLPEVVKTDSAYREYINGGDGIVRRWIRAGAGGWRLDVADELPDGFLDDLRTAAKAEDADALILGEVWEDASNKESYGHRRRYLLGEQLDSVMNYPFREAILSFLTGTEAYTAFEPVLSILENYPPQVLRILMNHIGTHDTERALTVLAGEPSNGRSREWQASQSLNEAQRQKGMRLLCIAAAMQYTLPGVPCVYYGDEAGMEGYKDPFNRSCYPWGKEDARLLYWYRRLGQIRLSCPALREGALRPLSLQGHVIAYIRSEENGFALLCAFNAGEDTEYINLPPDWDAFEVVLGGKVWGQVLVLEPESCCLILKKTAMTM